MKANRPHEVAPFPHPNDLRILILGSGEGGKYLAWHMGQGGQTHRRRGTPMDRWLLPQYQLHAQQERDLEREGRGFGVHVRLSDVDELEISRSSPVDTGGPSRGGGAGA